MGTDQYLIIENYFRRQIRVRDRETAAVIIVHNSQPRAMAVSFSSSKKQTIIMRRCLDRNKEIFEVRLLIKSK